ncbi:MAG: hypothetical protein R3C28_26395 [Pirellulaceae bacterium]
MTGQADITIRATDPSLLFVQDTFHVQVNEATSDVYAHWPFDDNNGDKQYRR